MNGISFGSVMLIIAGILIIAFPNILETLVAVILIVIGINGLIFGARAKKVFRIEK